MRRTATLLSGTAADPVNGNDVLGWLVTGALEGGAGAVVIAVDVVDVVAVATVAAAATAVLAAAARSATSGSNSSEWAIRAGLMDPSVPTSRRAISTARSGKS
jgi:hypothetical protein